MKKIKGRIEKAVKVLSSKGLDKLKEHITNTYESELKAESRRGSDEGREPELKVVTSNPSYLNFWSRDPFEVAKDFCGSTIEVYKSNGDLDIEAVVLDVCGWRDVPRRRGEMFRGSKPGTLDAFPLRPKPRSKGGGHYRILSVVANSEQYPIGVVTVQSVRIANKTYSKDGIFEALNLDPKSIPGDYLVVKGERLLEPRAISLDNVVQGPYEVGRYSTSDMVQGFRIGVRDYKESLK